MKRVRILTLKEKKAVSCVLPFRGEGKRRLPQKQLFLLGTVRLDKKEEENEIEKAEDPEEKEETAAAAPDRLFIEKARQRRFRALYRLRKNPDEERLWDCAVAFQNYEFRTYSGLPFIYTIKKGKSGRLTKELWVDRRANSKSLVWSSVLLAYRSLTRIGETILRPKMLGDIRGVTYIYGLFYRFGLIEVPEWARENMTFSKGI